LNIAKFILNPLLDFVYPPVCISCDTLLSEGSQKVCKNCWSTVPALSKSHSLYQKTLNKLVVYGCIDDLVSCYIFEREGPSQHIAHALKYQEYKSLGLELGKKLGRLVQDWNVEVDVIIPVPLHRIKHRERGYNQSEYIAQGIAAVIEKPILSDAVRRKRNTQTQTKLNFEERQKNMKNAFETSPNTSEKLRGKACLLVDDIITTGATMNSCAKEILTAGPKSIIAASAALAK
jgi:ComF family protein